MFHYKIQEPAGDILCPLPLMTVLTEDKNSMCDVLDAIEKRGYDYDYLDNDVMAIWMETEDAAGNVEKVIRLIESEEILENDLKKAAEVYISEEDCAELDQCKKVYPENR